MDERVDALRAEAASGNGQDSLYLARAYAYLAVARYCSANVSLVRAALDSARAAYSRPEAVTLFGDSTSLSALTRQLVTLRRVTFDTRPAAVVPSDSAAAHAVPRFRNVRIRRLDRLDAGVPIGRADLVRMSLAQWHEQVAKQRRVFDVEMPLGAYRLDTSEMETQEFLPVEFQVTPTGSVPDTIFLEPSQQFRLNIRGVGSDTRRVPWTLELRRMARSRGHLGASLPRQVVVTPGFPMPMGYYQVTSFSCQRPYVVPEYLAFVPQWQVDQAGAAGFTAVAADSSAVDLALRVRPLCKTWGPRAGLFLLLAWLAWLVR
ncbi:MAG: hypothetical protein AB1505_34840 [Candidatus Latescibacterota bacterium]